MDENKNLFWQLIEAKMGPVPNYLKNVLTLRGYENAMSIKTIDQKAIDSFQKYLSSEEIRERIPPDSIMEDYLGVMWRTPDKAYILPGHVQFLEQIVAFVNLTLVTKGHEYFIMKTKVNQLRRIEHYTMLLFSY